MTTDSSASARRPLIVGQPSTSAHKLVGTLNILFASVLLLAGLCCGLSMAWQAAAAPMLQGMQQQMRAAQARARAEANQAQQVQQAQIDQLEKQEQLATSDEEKEALKAQRNILQQQAPTKVAATVVTVDYMAPYRDARVMGYFWGDFVSGLLLNLLLLVSGIGLLASRSWARKLAVWTTMLKLVRLVAVYGTAIALVVPVFAQGMAEMMEQQMAMMQQRGGMPPQMSQTLAITYSLMLTAGAVLMILIGAIYPAVVLWVLTRPKVKRACGETLATGPGVAAPST